MIFSEGGKECGIASFGHVSLYFSIKTFVFCGLMTRPLGKKTYKGAQELSVGCLKEGIEIRAILRSVCTHEEVTQCVRL